MFDQYVVHDFLADKRREETHYRANNTAFYEAQGWTYEYNSDVASNKLGYDVKITTPARSYIVEEKNRGAYFSDLCVEYESRGRYVTPGWAKKDLLCDFMLYFMPGTVYLVHMKKLKSWFIENEAEIHKEYRLKQAANPTYVTLSRLVPWNVLEDMRIARMLA